MSRLLIQYSHLEKSYGPQSLFDGITMAINEGDTVALIGENGAGKTTLLQILAGQCQPDAGHLIKAADLTIGYLAQELSLSDLSISVREFLSGKLSILEQLMNSCLENGDRLDEWQRLHDKYELLGGYRRIPLEKVLSGLKLDGVLLDRQMADFSSGQRIRLALAKELIENPQLLLLDEPTNHLDQEMVQWLQDILKTREGATVIVSHDRKFLNNSCNRLVELQGGKVSCFGGSYDFYLEEKRRLLERQMKAFAEQEEERTTLKQKIKATTFARGKPSGAKDNNEMAYDRRGEKHQKSLHRSLEGLKSRLAEIEANPLEHPKPKNIKGLRFAVAPLASAIAVEMIGVSKGYGGKELFSDITRTLKKNDRIILTGANGSGKTTLLRCIAGLETCDKGLIKYAPTAKIAYLDQEIDLLPLDKTPLQYFETLFKLDEEAVRRELHMAALGGAELLHRRFSQLSVGQRKRLMLLALILQKPNVLLLDEPTNHLDLLTLEAFEAALLNFEGAILAVSHDATFIEKIATELWKMVVVSEE